MRRFAGSFTVNQSQHERFRAKSTVVAGMKIIANINCRCTDYYIYIRTRMVFHGFMPLFSAGSRNAGAFRGKLVVRGLSLDCDHGPKLQ